MMDDSSARAQSKPRSLRRSPRTRSVLAATALLAIGLSPFAVAKTGDFLREGKRNGTTTKETEVISRISAGNGPKGGYATRQSNVSGSGGGAIYGCRASSLASSKPCVRANNLSTGRAFEFSTLKGLVAGIITAGSGGDTKKPFVTNATGVATGLNADRVDSKSASELQTRWLIVNEKGVIEAQSGGFKILDCYTTNANCYIDSGDELANNGLSATISLQNGVNVDGVAGADPNFGGEISIARCQVPGVVECAPPTAKNTKAFVVSPRNSDGSATTATTRKRFYASISE